MKRDEERRGWRSLGRTARAGLELADEVNEELDRLRIAHRVGAGRLLQRHTQEQLLDWHLHFLAAQCAGHLGNGNDLVRHMMRRDLAAQGLLQTALKVFIEVNSLAQHNEQGQVIAATGALYSNNQTIEHLGKALDDAVDLAASHANPLAIDRRI